MAAPGHIHPRDRIDAFLTNGGSARAIGNYLSTPTRFTWTPIANRIAKIHRIIITVEDTGAFDAAKYGNNLVLVGGISLTVRRENDSQIHNYTAGKVYTNADWGARAFDVDVKTWGTGNEILVARWSFDKAGSAIVLHDGAYISIDLNDDFTNLVNHRFMIQGEYE
jgi:hypothetical protein